MIGCKVRAWFIQNKTSKEGEVLPNYQRKLRISIDEGGYAYNMFCFHSLSMS